MLQIASVPIAILILYKIIVVYAWVSDDCSSNLTLTNDGPVTLDVPVTISAHLSCVPNSVKFLFRFETNKQKSIEVIGNNEATANFVFRTNPGVRIIRVHVYITDPVRIVIASAAISVEVYEYIPGNLTLSGTIEDKDGLSFIGTGWDTNITLEIHLPRQVLQDAEFAFSWTIGDDRFTNDQTFTVYRFDEPGLKIIKVAIVGRIPDYEGQNHFYYKWGYFSKEITVKNPFISINISGNTYLEHGQLLDLDISCNGSGPVDYCWKLLPPSGNHTNLTCTEPVISSECSIPILYYFRNSGDYQLAIYVSNVVSSLQRNVEVHIYDVSLRPQLSMVIIPVACTVMVVIIIAVAVINHMRRRTEYNIETADFDFMKIDEPSAVAVETSWEHMWRSLVQLLQLRCLCDTVERETTAHYGAISKERTNLQ